MRLLFVSGLYSTSQIEQLRKDSNSNIQNAVNVYQWNVVDGLWRNNVSFDVVSLPFLPAYPMRYRYLYTPQGDIVINDKTIGHVLSFCDLVVWKKYSIQYTLERYIQSWVEKNVREEKLIILTYTPSVSFVKAARNVKRKFPNKNIEVVSIITDLVDDMLSFSSNRRFLKRIQSEIETRETKRLYKYIDKFVLLSKYMVEKIPEAANSFMVMEGLAVVNEFPQVAKASTLRTLLYTGILDDFAGVGELVEAFRKTTNPNFRLEICGSGALANMIKQVASEDNRIIFKGLVSREEAVELQQKATLLINPRKPNNQITRYSFPSKTMEYLSSGTPMLGYKLEGIPEEYYNYYYTVDNLEVDYLTSKIEEILSLPQDVLDEKAWNAYHFIAQYKTAEKQVAKMLDFIRE